MREGVSSVGGKGPHAGECIGREKSWGTGRVDEERGHSEGRQADPGQSRACLKCVIGTSLTHMMTPGTKINVTSLLYNRSSVQNN